MITPTLWNPSRLLRQLRLLPWMRRYRQHYNEMMKERFLENRKGLPNFGQKSSMYSKTKHEKKQIRRASFDSSLGF